MFEKRTDKQIDERMAHRMAKKGLPAKYAKMGFKKGWQAYKKANPGMVSMVRTLAGSRKRKRRKKGNTMAGTQYFGKARKRRKSRKSSRRMGAPSAQRQLVISMPAKRRKYRGEATSFAGKGRGMKINKKEILANLIPIFIGTGGAVAGNVAANLLPIPPKFKPYIPFLLGCGLAIFAGKNPLIKGLAYGMGIGGGLSLVKQLAGAKIPLLAGEGMGAEITEQDVEQALIEGKISPNEAAAILPHRAPELMGLAESYEGDDDDQEYSGMGGDGDFLTTESTM